MGLKWNLAGPSTRRPGGKGSKKIPSLLHEDWGFYPLFTLHSLFLEDFSVKDIQIRFSDSPALSAAFPSRVCPETVAMYLLKGSPFVIGRDYSGGSVPDSPPPWRGITGFPLSGYHLFVPDLTLFRIGCQDFFRLTSLRKDALFRTETHWPLVLFQSTQMMNGKSQSMLSF